MEIIDLQEDFSLKIYKTAFTEEFCIKNVFFNKYMNCKTLVIKLLCLASHKYVKLRSLK